MVTEKTIRRVIQEQAQHNSFRLYHSQPMPRSYSTIAATKRLLTASSMQLALIDAVVKK